MHVFDDLDQDQVNAIDRLIEQDHNFLICAMGGGKTVVAMSAIEELLEQGEIKRALVIAPLKVCQTVWRSEHKEWSHLHRLNIKVLAGLDAEDRKAFFKYPEDFSLTDITVINFELIVWMVENDLLKYFDALLIDESTKLKGGGKWFKSIRHHVKYFKWRTVMSGTPLTETNESIFYQMFIVDMGKSLGRNKDKFLRKYFYPTDFKQRNWDLLPGSGLEIARLVKGCVYTMPDYRVNLPPLEIEYLPVEISENARRSYKEMAVRMSTEGVTAESAAVQVMKLQQIANGFLYTESEVIDIHQDKHEKLMEKIRKKGVGNILIVYQFQEELDRLKDAMPEIRVLGEGDINVNVSSWNAGLIPVMALHPKSGGHGLNMARGGNTLIWISAPWSRDLFDQTNARLWRRGQVRPVTAFVLVASQTVDQLIIDRLDTKSAIQPAFLAHLADLD